MEQKSLIAAHNNTIKDYQIFQKQDNIQI